MSDRDSSSRHEDDEPLLSQEVEKAIPYSHPQCPRLGWWRIPQSVAIHLTFLMIYFAAFLIGGMIITRRAEVSCYERTSAWSPALEAVEYESVTYASAFNASSKYRGTPNPELDAAWTALVNQPAVKLSADEITSKLGKSAEYSVHFSEELGGEYTGFLDVFHQLHCVDMLRKYTYREYYPDYASFHDSETTIRIHLDHCIDMLRVNLMCTSDVSVLTYNWQQKKSWPNPDFGVTHKCRKFDKIVDWLQTSPRGTTQAVTKPENAPVVDK